MRTRRSSSGTLRATEPPGAVPSTGSCRTPTSRSACSAPSSGRERAPRSPRRRPAASDAAASPSSPATCSISSRDWLQDTFASERAHGLLAPWVLHTGLGPDAASSGFMTQVIAVAIQEGGMPVPKGGGARLADALVRLIEDNGGTCRTSAEVDVRPRAATAAPTGVRTTGGETFEAARAVIANVTPTQLYGRLLGDPDRPRSPRRDGASATAAPRCRSTSRSPSRPAGQVTSGSPERRSSTSHPGSTGSRARSTRPSAACCRPRRRSSAGSR